MAQTCMRNSKTLYDSQNKVSAEDTVKEWINLQHLSLETISEYFNKMSKIISQMEQDRNNPQFAPHLATHRP
ncbi:hypothetical protein HDU99_000658 [Rhizoclosmatium hyalinum]|nr:hypothetical protein HDU99_000658 [Rhizoclosmatium hyalinum]